MTAQIKGFRQKKTPNKKQVVDTYQQQLSSLASSISQQYSTCIQKIMNLERELSMQKQHLELVDYRSLATLKQLEIQNVFAPDVHTATAEKLKLEHFEELSTADDEKRGLIPVADRGAENGDIITVSIDAFDATSNEKIDGLSAMRSKLDLGQGTMSVIEKELKGLVTGESKEFTLKLGKEFGEFADKDVKFVIQAIALKTFPPKEELSAPKEAKQKETAVEGRDS